MCVQVHVLPFMYIYIHKYVYVHMNVLFFIGDLNTVLNFFFLYRFSTDMQMINFTTGEFQLTKACPYQVGCHL